jgi:hypothetical protein
MLGMAEVILKSTTPCSDRIYIVAKLIYLIALCGNIVDMISTNWLLSALSLRDQSHSPIEARLTIMLALSRPVGPPLFRDHVTLATLLQSAEEFRCRRLVNGTYVPAKSPFGERPH